jgi:hypothetical protein
MFGVRRGWFRPIVLTVVRAVMIVCGVIVGCHHLYPFSQSLIPASIYTTDLKQI